MSRYLLRRLLLIIPVLLVVSIVAFGLIRLAPGDPVLTMYGQSEGFTTEQYQAMRTRLGLDQPVTTQYLLWLGRAIRGDFGASILEGRPVLGEIADRLPATFELAFSAFLLALVMAVPLGLVSAFRPGSFLGRLINSLSTLGISTPIFLIGMLAMYALAYRIRLFKPDGYVPLGDSLWGNLQHLALPSLTLGLALTAGNVRFVRNAVLDILNKDYVGTARAKGLKPYLIAWRHILPNALIPLVTVLGLQFVFMLEGAIVTETLFGWPGLGQLAYHSVTGRDYPMVQGLVLFSAAVYLLVNLVVDLSYRWIDPRIRYAAEF